MKFPNKLVNHETVVWDDVVVGEATLHSIEVPIEEDEWVTQFSKRGDEQWIYLSSGRVIAVPSKFEHIVIHTDGTEEVPYYEE